MTELEKLKFLSQFVDYDKCTGEFVWNYEPKRGHKCKGKSAKYRGTSCNQIKKGIDGKSVSTPARRLAWFMVTGEVPDGEVTSVNGNPFDDRFSSLQIGIKPNHKKKGTMRTNKYGTGVSFIKRDCIFKAECIKNGIVHRAYFKDRLDAEVWVIEKRNELGFQGHLHGRVDQ